MIKIVDNKDCCGCFACYASCPKMCISMEMDTEGFWYPKVDASQCVECGLCLNLCPQPILYESEKTIGIAAVNIDYKTRIQSSSGGIFSILADYVIEQDGIVFGAFLDDQLNVVHDYAQTREACMRFRGSKYVQSNIGDAFKICKQFLMENKLVYFSGTACQIYGLKAYLRKDYDNLICQDIACHGVASSLLWGKYIEYQERKNRSKIVSFDFRNKCSGWKQYSIQAVYKNGKRKTVLSYDDLYMRAYKSKLCLRPSCYFCKVKGLERQADISLADFWGVEHIMPQMDDDLGTSLVLVHTYKGKNLINQILDKIRTEPVDLKEAIVYNPAIVKSVEMPVERSQFIEDIHNERFDKVVRKYCGDSLALKFKIKVYRMLNKIGIK